MRIVTRLLGIVAALAVVLIFVGLLLPDRAHVERSLVIDAPPEKIFPLLNEFRQFNRWSPWFSRDPKMEIAYEGPERGAGAKMHWRSEHPEVGAGSQEIIASEPHTRVATQLDFGTQGTASAEFRLIPQGDATRVTWGFDSEFGGNLVARYFGLLFDRMIGPDYEAGLARLKTLAEARE